MIAFPTLGKKSRLGNHLFQYAFLRTTAQRLGVKFYCPNWIGDSVFCLNDQNERATDPGPLPKAYKEPYTYTGLNQSALLIEDQTEIQGYFQTDKYFDTASVRRWYTFKEDQIAHVREKFSHVDFENSVGLSVRLGDFVTVYGNLFYVPRTSYYQRALELTPRSHHVIVFSDDIIGAKLYLNRLNADFTFVDGYQPYEGLYLQSLCRDFICSPSTYSWWGAWLNSHPDRVIVAPKEGSTRPGARVRNLEFWPSEWLQIPALRFGLDHFFVEKQRRFVRRGVRKLARILGGAPRPKGQDHQQ